jgi:hypothetical protein
VLDAGAATGEPPSGAAHVTAVLLTGSGFAAALVIAALLPAAARA